MNNTKSAYQTTIKNRLAIGFFSLLPVLCFAFEAPEEIKQLTINELLNKQNAITELGIDNKPITKSKSDLEKLFGTWFFSYTLDNVTHKDRIELDSIYEYTDGSLSARGQIFLDNKDEGELILCSELPFDLASFHSSDYQCNGLLDVIPNIYVFKFSGNTITNGYFGTGNSSRDIANHVSNHSTRLTGGRENTAPLNTETYYDDATGDLVIPSLIYKGSKYKVILEDTGGFLFSVKEAQPL